MATAARVAPVPDEPRGGPATAVGGIALFLTVALPGWHAANACPRGMVAMGDQYRIDRCEATLDQDSRAVSTPGALPAVNLSGVQAAAACAAAAKRLCTNEEWIRACKGPNGFTYPYGNTLVPGQCNDQGALAVTGAHPGCVSSEGACVNAVLTQPVSASNYLSNVNAGGTLSIADLLFVNARLTRFVPPPVSPAGGKTGSGPGWNGNRSRR